MTEARSFYVYALKDGRTEPAKPFYIGKGTGTRAWEHELQIDDSAKGARIREIHDSGSKVLVSKLVEELTEVEALRIEAELIVAFGTIASGGPLANIVIPKLMGAKGRSRNLVVPSAAVERAQIGLRLLKEAVLELANANEPGITNSDAAHSLGLQSDYLGGSKDYLTWSILGLLMREGRMKRVEKKRHQAQVR